MTYTYCSFAEDEFRGAVVLEGEHDAISAAIAIHAMGLSPGGQLIAVPVPPDIPELEAYAKNTNRLLTKDECIALFRAERLGDLLDAEADL